VKKHMRISGGEAKGRTLHFPSKCAQRPTTDFLREALFNVLKLQPDQSFLDLFAGSGAVGLEAASRGSKKVVFVEKNRILADLLRRNVSAFGYEERCTIIQGDVQGALRSLGRKKNRFAVVFADPPYNEGFIGETLNTLSENPVLQENGLIILQHSVREQPQELPDGWFLSDQRKYGDNLLTFIRMAVNHAREI
jgi:16S rRNA (guanine966-N2)-methyltransferase